MIRPLRQLHRRIAIALGVFLPVAFVTGIAARKPAPVMVELPAAFAPASQKFESTEWERAGLFANAPVQVRLLREQKKSGRFALALAAAKDFVPPDLIVYWVAGNPNLTGALPDEAILLGPFNSTALPLGDEVVKTNGALILYSLADSEIVDASKPVQFSTIQPSREPWASHIKQFNGTGRRNSTMPC